MPSLGQGHQPRPTLVTKPRIGIAASGRRAGTSCWSGNFALSSPTASGTRRRGFRSARLRPRATTSARRRSTCTSGSGSPSASSTGSAAAPPQRLLRRSCPMRGHTCPMRGHLPIPATHRPFGRGREQAARANPLWTGRIPRAHPRRDDVRRVRAGKHRMRPRRRRPTAASARDARTVPGISRAFARPLAPGGGRVALRRAANVGWSG
jgi:hypothetical protein